METQYISLNMTPTGVNPCFHISQYDVGRMLGFIVHSGGATVDLDTYTCTIEATRSDGTAITSAVATTDNIGTFEVTPTMSNKADKYRCQLVIVDANSKRIASLPFDMEVTKAAMDENSEAIEEDASLYQQYTEAVQGAIAEANADIQAEASARQAADNTLQSNINAEASTRASTDFNLQSQINQIIAPSGEAPSAAEVQNARIGADGVTYDTLGEAIRGQVTDLKSALNHIETRKEFSSDTSGGHNFSFDFISGQKYKLKNGSIVAISASTKQGSTTVDTISENIGAGKEIYFTASGNANVLNVYGGSSLSSIVVECLDRELPKMKSDIGDLVLEKDFITGTGGYHGCDFEFKNGQQYIIKNNSDAAVSLTTTLGVTNVQTITDNLAVGASIKFTASGDANILVVHCSVAISIRINKYWSIYDRFQNDEENIATADEKASEAFYGLYYLNYRKECESSIAGGYDFSYTIEQGKKYRLINNSARAVSVTTKEGSSVVQNVTDNLRVGYSLNFVASGNASKINIYGGGAYSVTIECLDNVVPTMQKEIDEQTIYRTFTTNASGTYFFQFLFMSGEKYVIKNNSANAISIETDMDKIQAQTLTDNLVHNGEYSFTANAEANQLKVYCSSSISIIVEKLIPSFIELKESVDSEIEAMSEDVEEVKDIVESMEGMASVAYVDSAIASASIQGANVTAVVNTKGRQMRPIVSFTDDDCRAEVYTLLKPILDSKNVKASLALEAGEINGTGYMTSAQLIEMVNNGHGLMFHGYNEINFTQVTIAELTRQLNLSLEKLDDWNIDRGVMSTVAYPQGSENLSIRTWSSGHFKAGLDVFRDGINHSPLGQFVIGRINFGEANNPSMKAALNSPYDTNTLDFYKWCVDKAIAENGWLIFMSHAWMSSFDSTQQGYLADLIDYIRSKFVDIMTVDEAIESIGNLITIGDYNKPFVCETNYLAVGCDGTIESDMTANFIAKHGSFTSDSLPTDFPVGKIIHTPINYSESQSHSYPGNTYGGLSTHMEFYRMTDYATPYYDAVYQTYTTASGAQYIRFAKDDGSEWKAWKQISIS